MTERPLDDFMSLTHTSHFLIDFITLVPHIIAIVKVELNFVTGKWSLALKIDVSASPKRLYNFTYSALTFNLL